MVLASALPHRAPAQDRTLSMQEYEDSLAAIYLPVWTAASETERYATNDIFMDLFQEALASKEAFRYPFESLKYISSLSSPDKTFHIYTWYVARNDGTFEFFGVIHRHNKSKKAYERFLLNDTSDEMRDPERESGDHTKWYGAQYFKLIYTKNKGRRYYTLLGWDGYNNTTNRKVIEILTFRSNGKPVFGYAIFKCDRSRIKRYIFEYSEQAGMALRWEEQYLTYSRRQLKFPGSGKKKKPEKTRKVAERMIVFDRLVPLHPSLEDHYEFYVPSTNVVDGFLFRGGRWHLAKDVDARNPDHPFDKLPQRPKDGLLPPE